jgi:hypothetical protein
MDRARTGLLRAPLTTAADDAWTVCIRSWRARKLPLVMANPKYVDFNQGRQPKNLLEFTIGAFCGATEYLPNSLGIRRSFDPFALV